MDRISKPKLPRLIPLFWPVKAQYREALTSWERAWSRMSQENRELIITTIRKLLEEHSIRNAKRKKAAARRKAWLRRS